MGTDQESRNSLHIERRNRHSVVDDVVMAPDGKRSMLLLVRGGMDASTAIVQSHPDPDVRVGMLHQVVRDEGDVCVAEVVDTLRPGEMYWTVSMDPKEALRGPYRELYRNLGYLDGLAYIQTYYRQSEGELITHSYSVFGSDAQIWRRVQARHDVSVPLGTSSDTWIRYGRKQTVTAEEAATFASELRDEYYGEIGMTASRQSVNEFIESRTGIVNEYFDRYMIPLASAVYTQRNNAVMQGFARALQATDAIGRLSPNMRRELLRVSNLQSFSAEAGRVMEDLIRYALVERLRQELPQLITGGAAYIQRIRQGSMPMENRIDYETLNRQLAGNIATGVQAGREYSGCASLRIGNVDEQESSKSPQEAFGGRDSEELKIPDNIRCIKCNRFSPKEMVIKKDRWRCPKCKYQVDICTGQQLQERRPNHVKKDSQANRGLVVAYS